LFSAQSELDDERQRKEESVSQRETFLLPNLRLLITKPVYTSIGGGDGKKGELSVQQTCNIQESMRVSARARVCVNV